MADESVQPVPCVFFVSMRSPRSHSSEPSGVTSRSFASAVPWPPFTRTALPHAAAIARAASAMSASPSMRPSARISASGMLGVTTLASGSSSRLSTSSASSAIRRDPDVDTMTGSTTTRPTSCARRPSAMARMIAAEETMPTLTASGRMSSKTVSI